jgi:hypothetical protein
MHFSAVRATCGVHLLVPDLTVLRGAGLPELPAKVTYGLGFQEDCGKHGKRATMPCSPECVSNGQVCT